MLDCTEVTVVDGVILRLVASDSGLRTIEFEPWRRLQGCRRGTHPVAGEAVRQLRAYFAGQLRCFDLPLDIQGTEFQLRVWRELEAIPFGETRGYSQIATAIGAPRAARGGGGANGGNPIPDRGAVHRAIGRAVS